jgi:hypothetical protein
MGAPSISRLPLPTSKASVATRRSVEGRYTFNGPDEEILEFGPYFYSARDLTLGVASEYASVQRAGVSA